MTPDEEKSDETVPRDVRPVPPTLSWKETAKAMAAASEDWRDWDVAACDGI